MGVTMTDDVKLDTPAPARSPRVPRYRRKNAKPGQLLVYYGKLPGDNPDMVFAWGGEGASKRASNILHYYMASKRVELVYGEDRAKNNGIPYKFGPSMFEALDAAGFDLRTLQFSIEFKKP